MAIPTTTTYDVANAQNTKEPVIVLQIEDLPFMFASATVFTIPRYDTGLFYDTPGLIYDGLVALGNDEVKTYIDRKKSFSTISQKLEQWDGKASIETLNISLVDVKGEITRLMSPGQVLNEILNKRVKIFFGYKNIPFESYIKLFTGYVNNYQINQGRVALLFTDPGSKRKTQLFAAATTVLQGAITDSQTTITMHNTAVLYDYITDGNGDYDPTVQLGFKIDDEIIYYNVGDIISSTQVQNCIRGSLDTTNVAHDDDAEVIPFIRIADNPITIALKLMLSGWNGPSTEGVGLRGIINTDDGGTIADSITFEQGVDLVRDYGLTIGDFIIMSGFTDFANNGTFTIRNFENSNRTAVLNPGGVLVQVNPPPSGDITGEVAFRSRYDTYPTMAGLSLVPDDVFVERYEYFRTTFIQVPFEFNIIGKEDSGKEFIEKEIMKVISAYTLTQGSRISMGLTHPPLASDLTKFFSPANIINPGGITVTRGLNTRFFYNEVFYQYDYDPVQDKFFKSIRVIDADAQDRMNQVSVLNIQAKGLPDSTDTEDFINQRSQRLLLRYRFSAETIEVETTFGTGHTIDAGDTVVLSDTTPPILKIPNTDTGNRVVLDRVSEVQERSIDISSAKTRVTLLSNNGFAFSDRYAVIGPSSNIDLVFTTSRFRITDSFFTQTPGAEFKKWEDYDGSVIRVHDDTYTNDDQAVFHLDASNPNILNLETPLSFLPTVGMVVEFGEYDDTDATVNSAAKANFASYDSAAFIASGSSPNVFTLQAGFATRYLSSGQIIYVMSPNGNDFSPDVKILSIVGDIVTVGPIFVGGAQDLGFTPASGYIMQLGGFKDGGAGYRYI